MPPYHELLQEIPRYVARDNASNNTTSPSGPPSNTVSWQSAFWPVVACTMAVMLQSTGRVLNESFADSSALRSSPIVCIVDALFMLAKLVILQSKGCTLRVASMHVWYDRFEHEDADFRAAWTTLLGKVFPGLNGTFSASHPSISAFESTPNTRLAAPVHSSAMKDADLTRSSGTLARSAVKVESRNDDVALEIDLGDLNPRIANASSSKTPSIDEEGGLARPIMGGREGNTLQDMPLVTLSSSKIPHPGSSIDRAWRWTMTGFVIGALPQAMKIFCMKGIPLTQTFVALSIASFIMPEIFRAVAGPADGIDLRPMPIVVDAKRELVEAQRLALLCTTSIAGFLAYMFTLALLFWRPSYGEGTSLLRIGAPTAFTLAAPLAILTTLGVATTVHATLTAFDRLLKLRSCLTATYWFSCCELSTRDPGPSSAAHSTTPASAIRAKVRCWILKLFALDPSTSTFRLTFISSFIPMISVSTLLTVWLKPGHWEVDMGWGALVGFLLWLSIGPVVLSALYIIFRLVFMGSLSRLPRKLFGLEGCTSEFVAGAFVMSNFFVTFACYAFRDSLQAPFYEGTYKPSWAEWLG